MGKHDRRRPWQDSHPLVFINACHSAQLDPSTLCSLVNAFVTDGLAAGVIGTEVRVDALLAMEFAQHFFGDLLASLVAGPESGGPAVGTVDGALRRTRLRFLARGNLLGLAYVAHAPADLAYEVH